MSNAKKLFINTVMLTATAFLMRTVSVSFNVYLTNIIGAEGIGLFQLISAVYATATTFSVAGIRLASMRLIADSLAVGKQNQRQIMNKCLIYAVFCATGVSIILTGAADIIAEQWIGHPGAALSLKTLSISLPFVSMSAALNGYFTAESKIKRYTFIQLCEQIFKIGITVLFVKSVDEKTIEKFCNGVVCGISLSEMFSLGCSYLTYRFSSRQEKDKHSKNTIKNILRIALPDAIGSEMRSVLTTIEHILIPKGLKKSGGSAEKSIATYGTVHGMALPIVLYPAALITSLSGLLVPEISSHHVSGQKKRIHYIIRRVVHLALMFSIGTAGIIFFNGERLSLAFYGNTDCGFYIKILAPLVIIMYMDTTVDGILKGLDQQISYMKYNIIDAGSCVVFVYFMIPVMGVKGYIFVIYLSELINFIFSFRRVGVVSEITVDLFKDLVIPFLSIIAACLCVEFVGSVLTPDINHKISAAFYIIAQSVLYVSALRFFGAIDTEEVNWIKKLIRKN